MEIQYDAWDLAYKKPFGAVKKGQDVTWKLWTQEDTMVDLLIIKEGSGQQLVAYPMQKDTEDKCLNEIQLKIGDAGLYHYYFRVLHYDQVFFYGKGQGGKGQLYPSQNEVNAYQLTCYTQESSEVPWYRNGVVYQIFPDRFYNGNPYGRIDGRKKNSFIYATPDDEPYLIRDAKGNVVRWDFFGGNLEGIRQKIPYLKDLGVTTLYLNPIFEATTSHRYDTNDFMKIDPMLGTSQDFQRLLTDLHKNKMHLILDGVFNHVGVDSKYFNANALYGEGVGAAQSKKSPYYPWFNFEHYPDKYRCWWGVTTLPEVDKNNADYQDFIYGSDGVIDKWTKFGVDGWRIDVADELPMVFLKAIRDRLKANHKDVLIGEVWEDSSNKYVDGQWRPYIDGDNLIGTMNYPFRKFILDILRAESNLSEVAAVNQMLQVVENYPREYLQNCLNNLGTHDTERIKYMLGEDDQMVALAFAMMFALPGVPCIYYGDEAGVTGKKDPDNRRFFPWGKEDKFLQANVKHLAQMRKQNKVMVKGKVGLVLGSYKHLGIVRYYQDQVLTTWLNWGGEVWQPGIEALTCYGLPAEIQAQILQNSTHFEVPAKGYRIINR